MGNGGGGVGVVAVRTRTTKRTATHTKEAAQDHGGGGEQQLQCYRANFERTAAAATINVAEESQNSTAAASTFDIEEKSCLQLERSSFAAAENETLKKGEGVDP